MVTAEAQFTQQLVSNVSNDNEADAIVLVGSTGFGPRRDAVCEALAGFLERQIEGFPESVPTACAKSRAWGPRAWMLPSATAGVYNRCLVFAMTGRATAVRSAMRHLIMPSLSDAVELATGRTRCSISRAKFVERGSLDDGDAILVDRERDGSQGGNETRRGS